jgi:hypothetical protein
LHISLHHGRRAAAKGASLGMRGAQVRGLHSWEALTVLIRFAQWNRAAVKILGPVYSYKEV